MADARTLVPVLRVRGIEPKIEAEWLILVLRLNEFDAAVANQVGLMPRSAIRQCLKVRIAIDRFKGVELGCWRKACWGAKVPFPKQAGAIAGLAQLQPIDRAQ